MIGTKESGTGVKLLTASFGASLRSMSGKCSKKSSRLMCRGATARVSISDPAEDVSHHELIRLLIHNNAPGPKTPSL
jgi:hypothetical protein